jgi:hypothetical protein
MPDLMKKRPVIQSNLSKSQACVAEVWLGNFESKTRDKHQILDETRLCILRPADLVIAP